MEALPEAVLFVHRATLRVGAANPAACQVLGYTLDELRGVELAQIVADAPGLVPTARREAPDPSAPGSECLVAEKAALRNRAGALVPVECRVRIVASPSGEYLVLVVGGRSDQLSAVSHQPSASRAADSSFIPHPSSLIPPFLPPHPAARGGGRLATCPTSPPQGRDAVTGLPDRRQFEGRLMVALRKARCRADYHFAVLFIDLDGFKAVNDAWGHLHGDRVLQAIGARLAGCIRPEDMVARFGGDEFTVLLDDLHSPPDAIRVAERIRLQLETPLEVEGRRSALGASIGIALSWLGYRDPEAMLQDADRAMYRAKAEGKARYFVWERGREEG
jgi:diguanylate cyclase (GGDEF)-like protein